jgi:Mrp family chromosome partitioning ATPase
MTNGEGGMQALRVFIEAQIALPALLLVTSGTEADNGGGVARALARAFVEAGKNAMVVDAIAGRMPDVPAVRNDALDVVSVLPNREFGAKLDVLRAGREVTIVYAAPLLSHAAGLELARRADGVLIAVRLGRTIRREDELMKQVLEKLGARVLGIVQTSAGPRGRRSVRDIVERLPFPKPLRP